MKLVVLITLSTLAIEDALAQGTVDMGNPGAPFYDSQGVRLEGPAYLAQLYFWTADGGFRPAAGNPLPFSTNGYLFLWRTCFSSIRTGVRLSVGAGARLGSPGRRDI